MSSGASTIPMKMFADTPTPSAPPMPMLLRRSREKPRTSLWSTPQWNRSADRALSTMIMGRDTKANTHVEEPGVGVNGNGPPPR